MKLSSSIATGNTQQYLYQPSEKNIGNTFITFLAMLIFLAILLNDIKPISQRFYLQTRLCSATFFSVC